MFIPPVNLPILFAVSSSAFLNASFTALKIKSSNISTSSESTTSSFIFTLKTSFFPLKAFYVFMLRRTSGRNLCEFSFHIKCGPGLYIGHPYCIVINPDAVIGSHVNIAKGVTIGPENRGKRMDAFKSCMQAVNGDLTLYRLLFPEIEKEEEGSYEE